jgi:hypothetical protein
MCKCGYGNGNLGMMLYIVVCSSRIFDSSVNMTSWAVHGTHNFRYQFRDMLLACVKVSIPASATSLAC